MDIQKKSTNEQYTYEDVQLHQKSKIQNKTVI
jgi:hypothetical protein